MRPRANVHRLLLQRRSLIRVKYGQLRSSQGIDLYCIQSHELRCTQSNCLICRQGGNLNLRRIQTWLFTIFATNPNCLYEKFASKIGFKYDFRDKQIFKMRETPKFTTFKPDLVLCSELAPGEIRQLQRRIKQGELN